MKIPSLLEMIKAGVHFGHRVSKWHPKMKPYIFTARNTVHIIDLEKTVEKLKEALEFVKKIAEEGGTILIVGTKKSIREIVKKWAIECKMPYVTESWIGGTLTNFFTIYKLVEKLKHLEAEKEKGELEKYTKKEQLEFDREIKRLDEMVGGIRDLEGLPQALYIVDLKEEKTALREAQRKGIPVVAMVDTNVNPENVDFPIPANDDAIKSVEMMTRLVKEAVEEGQASGKVKSEKAKVKSTKSD